MTELSDLRSRHITFFTALFRIIPLIIIVNSIVTVSIAI